MSMWQEEKTQEPLRQVTEHVTGEKRMEPLPCWPGMMVSVCAPLLMGDFAP